MFPQVERIEHEHEREHEHEEEVKGGVRSKPAAGGGDSCSAIGVANRRAEPLRCH